MHSKKNLAEGVQRLFPKKASANMPLGDSEHSVLHELSRFKDMQWPDVPLNLLMEEFEAPFFFSAEAFHYYTPAYLRLSLDYLPEMELCLNNYLSVFSSTENDEWMRWKKRRITLFNSAQWQLISRWMEWLGGEKKTDDLVNFEDAYLMITTGGWPKVNGTGQP